MVAVVTGVTLIGNSPGETVLYGVKRSGIVDLEANPKGAQRNLHIPTTLQHTSLLCARLIMRNLDHIASSTVDTCMLINRVQHPRWSLSRVTRAYRSLPGSWVLLKLMRYDNVACHIG
jgi:hypothetical protein